MADLKFLNTLPGRETLKLKHQYNEVLGKYRKLERNIDAGNIRAGELEISELRKMAFTLSRLLERIGDVSPDEILGGFKS